jgi:uncharacterized protein YjaG (DUF416 family)
MADTGDDLALKLVASLAIAELKRATALHGSFNSAHEGYAIILEELDELWDLVKVNPAKIPFNDREAHKKKILEEAIQVAAMGMRFALDVCVSPK